MDRPVSPCIALLGLCLVPCLTASPADAGWLWSHGECSGSSVSLDWVFNDDPGGLPEFVAYDVYRQSMPLCEPAIRVNEQPFPRLPGTTHGHTFVDAVIAPQTMYHYEIVPVDANRQPVQLPSPPLFCDPCVRDAWAGCPEFGAPLTHGTLEDEGWALFVWRCPGTCYSEFLIERPWPPELEPYVGTGIALQLFGPYVCGGIEGCEMQVTNFEVAPCGATAVEPRTWGAIKATYE